MFKTIHVNGKKIEVLEITCRATAFRLAQERRGGGEVICGDRNFWIVTHAAAEILIDAGFQAA